MLRDVGKRCVVTYSKRSRRKMSKRWKNLTSLGTGRPESRKLCLKRPLSQRKGTSTSVLTSDRETELSVEDHHV